MTLIIGCLTPDFVFLVSDRRLTDFRTGRVMDDAQNKAVQFENQAAFAACGLPELDGTRIDQWIAERLDPTLPLDDALDKLAAEAEEALGRARVPAGAGLLGFFGVGWGTCGESSLLRPFFFTASNFRSSSGDWFRDRQPSFGVCIEGTTDRFLRRNNAVCFASDPSIPSGEIKLLARTIKRALAHGVSISTCLGVLAAAVRQRGRLNSTIGDGVLGMVLPRTAVESNTVGTLGHFGRSTPTLPAFVAWASDSARWRIIGPCLVSTGMTVFETEVTFKGKSAPRYPFPGTEDPATSREGPA